MFSVVRPGYTYGELPTTVAYCDDLGMAATIVDREREARLTRTGLPREDKHCGFGVPYYDTVPDDLARVVMERGREIEPGVRVFPAPRL